MSAASYSEVLRFVPPPPASPFDYAVPAVAAAAAAAARGVTVGSGLVCMRRLSFSGSAFPDIQAHQFACPLACLLVTGHLTGSRQPPASNVAAESIRSSFSAGNDPIAIRRVQARTLSRPAAPRHQR